MAHQEALVEASPHDRSKYNLTIFEFHLSRLLAGSRLEGSG